MSESLEHFLRKTSLQAQKISKTSSERHEFNKTSEQGTSNLSDSNFYMQTLCIALQKKEDQVSWKHDAPSRISALGIKEAL